MKALDHTPWRPERKAFRPNKRVLRGKSRNGVKNIRATSKPAVK